MNAEQWFAERLKEYEHDPDYLAEEVLLDITEQISLRLEELNLSASDLASKLGVSRAYISQVMNGKPNLTIRSLVGIALALDQKVTVSLDDRHEASFDVREFNDSVQMLTPEHDDVDPSNRSRASAA